VDLRGIPIPVLRRPCQDVIIRWREESAKYWYSDK
jgi:hypothetical protein